MAHTDLYDRIFEYPSTDLAALVLTDPEEIAKGTKTKAIAAWELLLGSMQLRRRGQRSPANDWLNHATHLKVNDDVFRAELLGEAGQGLYDSDRLEDAFNILNSAAAIWRDTCKEAIDACGDAKRPAASDFALRLLPMFAGAKAKPPATRASIQSGKQAVQVVEQWLSDRAVMGRAQTIDTILRILAKAGQFDDARRLLKDELDWVALNFTKPAKPAEAHPLKKRVVSGSARRALYLLLLARGEVERAAGDFQASADGFKSAADIYEGRVQDVNDINRLLRAKFNEANSLLGLRRIKEAIGVYELCKHGFNSIDDSQAVQRVEHAILLARSMADDDDA